METIRASGRDVDVVSLAGYARSVLALLSRHGRNLPDDPTTIDWSTAENSLLRLVAVCLIAEAAGCL